MSLLNKMLRDLDARRVPSLDRAALPDDVHVTLADDKRTRSAAVLALALAAAAGWYWIGSDAEPAKRIAAVVPGLRPAPAAPPVASPPPVVAPAVPAPVAPAPAIPAAAEPAPAASAPAASAPTPKVEAAPVPKPEASASAPKPGASAPAAKLEASAPAPKPETSAPARPSAPPAAAKPSTDAAARPDAKSAGGKEKTAGDAPAPARSAPLPAKEASQPPTAEEPSGIEKRPRNGAVNEAAEREYDKALTALRRGAASVAVESLHAALRLDARHVFARQALVSLLLEQQQWGDARTVLEEGLALDPTQSGWAMALARLQFEGGRTTEAINLLMRHASHAGGNADYQAFLALLLQKRGLPAEAAARYRAALALKPAESRWWYGLGLVLEADHKTQEAREAYLKARETGNLPPELASAVDRRLR